MWPKRSTSMRVIAAMANPAAIRNGTATEARARYFAMTAVAADLASLSNPRNMSRALS